MSPTPVDLTPAENLRVLGKVLAPLVAQGAIVRRPQMTAWAERHQTDRTARAVLSDLRARHGGAPLVVRLGTRRVVVVTEPVDVRRLLEGSPEPFTPATKEKRAALAHFQPEGVLISSTAERWHRRPFNEKVLQTDQPVHDGGPAVVDAVQRGVADLSRQLRTSGRFDADDFAEAWWGTVLEVVLGPKARGDRELVAVLNALRSDANWSWLHPGRPHLREDLEGRIGSYLLNPEPGSLAAVAHQSGPATAVGQVPHWLFAFDAAGAATLRALAIVAARPAVRERLLAEAEPEGQEPALLPYARACVLESLRLWPTTFAVLRDSTGPTDWGERTLPAHTGFAVVSSFFHRDPDRLEHADGFLPEAWLDGRNAADWGLIPFSGGPAACPGRNFVLLVASHMLTRLAAHDLRVARGRYLARDPLPATVDHLGLRFRVAGSR
ncbi:cytochrome P450 [Promicromonospora iranensis]|uniref:Cytochrome P450 n=1 Tax=Promicromonospora iranensis TaxID=1105144 RepID=A0ABU2CTQ3_9MICO|nr:cytochrome P450 [Promicromonospora iranensis]MDR7384715.1 cytochrome P450 [Promicromonospora iranensis]